MARRQWRKVGSCSRLLYQTSMRCPSRSSDLIYDILQVWSDSYKERQTLIPHRHEHINFGDTWLFLLGACCMTCLSMHAYHIECKSQSTLLSQSWKARMCAHMSDIPMNFLWSHLILLKMKMPTSSSKTVKIPTSGRKPLFIIKFLYYQYLYLNCSSFM